MIFNVFLIFIPLFITTAAGFLLTRVFSLSENTMVRVITDFFMPLLIFYSLYNSDIQAGSLLNLFGVTSFVIFFLLGFSILYARIFKIERKSFIPPIIFMNSGFLGIPLMRLWGGLTAVNYIVVYDQIQTVYIFTLGIFIVTGGFSGKGLSEIIKSPLLWAIVTGFLCNFFNISLPNPILETTRFAGTAAAPLATFALGCSLSKRKPVFNSHLAAGTFFRIVLGFAAGVLAVKLFGVEGPLRTVIVVASSLPSAVFSFVLPDRYGARAEFAGSMVLVSTVVSVFTTPVAFAIAATLW
jgi:hypothetical protein